MSILFLSTLDKSKTTNRSKRYRPFLDFRRSLLSWTPILRTGSTPLSCFPLDNRPFMQKGTYSVVAFFVDFSYSEYEVWLKSMTRDFFVCLLGVIFLPLSTRLFEGLDFLTHIHQYWVRSECHHVLKFFTTNSKSL